MNSGYLTGSNAGIGIQHHSSPVIHHGNSFITNIHHNSSISPQTTNPHLSINNRVGNFDPLKLPLSNHLENHPALYNTTRQNTYSNHINLPTKPCIDSPDGSNYYQFTASTHPLGRLN